MYDGWIMGYNDYFYAVMTRYVLIPKNAELIRIPSDSLMFIKADGNFSKVYTIQGEYYHVPYQLGQLEDLISGQVQNEDENSFIRIGKSLIVNKGYISIIDTSNNKVHLSDFQGHSFILEASKKSLSKLKLIVENDKL